MARQSRARKLSLKLDVIMEEEHNSISDKPYDQIQNPSSHLQSGSNTSMCSLTIRTAKQSNTNEPQFLHTGRWPRMDMVDELIDPIVESRSNMNSAEITMATSNLSSGDCKKSGSTKLQTDTWKAITPDQLSMVMDYWDPDDETYPLTIHTMAKQNTTDFDGTGFSQPVTTAQELFFLREVMDEYLTRAQTVEYIDELEDNDNAIEIVAMLEGYRQNGWSDEMIKAFPRECWRFWSSSGLGSTSDFEEYHTCNESASPALSDEF